MTDVIFWALLYVGFCYATMVTTFVMLLLMEHDFVEPDWEAVRKIRKLVPFSPLIPLLLAGTFAKGLAKGWADYRAWEKSR